MKTKTFLLLVAILLLTSCFESSQRIKGHAVIVDNFGDRNPLEGIYKAPEI
jgi:hypothetical protein